MSEAINSPESKSRRFRPYPKYKDSGVEWLGKIPTHWGIVRVKEQFNVINGSTPSSSEPAFWDGDIVWVTPDDLGELDSPELSKSRRNITKEGYRSCGTSLVPKGSLVLSTRAPIGHLAIASVMLCTNQGCKSLVFKSDGNYRYFYYLLRSARPELESLGQGSTFSELAKSKLSSLIIIKPPKAEENAVAAFLERETAKFDALIEKKERLIELLQEKRAALITQAVTKGLDPNVPMKDSGVEWLGKIPGHWEVLALKRVVQRIQTGSTPPTSKEKYYLDGTVAWYGPGSFSQQLTLEHPAKFINELAVQEGAARLFDAGTTMIVTIGATIGKVGYLQQGSSANQQITGVSPSRDKFDTRFLAYQVKQMEPVLLGIASRTTLPILDQEEVGYLPVVVPPIQEQSQIVRFIELKATLIDEFAAKIRKGIELLKEYRLALISAGVTGKIDVRDLCRARA